MSTPIYKPKFFSVKELVTPEIYRDFGEDAIIGLDPYLLLALDTIRVKLGRAIVINTWHLEKVVSHRYRGLRPPNTQVGAPNSMHKMGKAFDFDVKGMTTQKVREWIIANRNEIPELKAITRMESNVSWVHIDSKFTGSKEIVLFKP